MLVTCIIILVLMITRSLASREASQEAKRTKAENSTLASLPKGRASRICPQGSAYQWAGEDHSADLSC